MSATMSILKGVKAAKPQTLDEALDDAEGTPAAELESFGTEGEAILDSVPDAPVDEDEDANVDQSEDEDLNLEAQAEAAHEVAIAAEDVELPKTKTAVHKLTAAQVEAVYAKLGGEQEVLGWSTLSADDKKAALMTALFGKKGAKGVVAASKSGEVLGPDPLATLALEIEGLKTQEEIEARIFQVQEEEGLSDFKLGGLFARLKEIGDFGEHANFQDYVSATFGVQYRKAMYQIAIYEGLTEASIPYDKVKKVGWTKLKELIPVLTLDNVDEWVEKALALNTDSLKQEVKAALLPAPAEGEETSEGSAPQTITNKTLKLHEDQKEVWDLAIAKAKEFSGTDSDTVAACFIMTDYISNSTGKKAPAKTEGVIIDGGPVTAEKLKKVYELALAQNDGDVEATLNLLLDSPFGAVFPNVEFKEIAIS